jgi:hypothetical protein
MAGHIVPALVSGYLASLLVEALLDPKPRVFWLRPLSCVALHTGVWLFWFGVGLLLFQRPFFVAAAGLAFEMLVVMINNAKFLSLREPFVYQDFEYLTDTLRHPRLYIPFLGWGRAAAAALAAIAAIAGGLAVEASILEVMRAEVMVALAGSFMLFGAAALILGDRLGPSASFDPADDLQRLGLVASLWRYWRAERGGMTYGRGAAGIPPVAVADAAMPDLLAIQSESFFDARAHFSGLRGEILAAFDALRAEAALRGRLTVPAWGANTVRTEFAFLSGLEPAALGVHRFNPYRRLARAGGRTLASALHTLGYRTVCIHPYPASFYRRDIVYRAMGFDEFIDITAFSGAERAGPYVGDVALAEHVTSVLEAHRLQSDKPLFVFVITMENHGPLHLERVGQDDAARVFAQAPPDGCDDLTVYARHLGNADQMLGLLHQYLRATPRECWLAVFGDHVPIMPAVYRLLGEPDGRTDYLLWNNRRTGAAHGADVDLAADRLAAALLGRMFAPVRPG